MKVICGCIAAARTRLRQRQHPQHALFDYQNSLAGRCPEAFLQGYNGYLQVGGYAGCEQTQATLVGCWAHARRKFKEAADAQVKGKTGKVDWALNHIQNYIGLKRRTKQQVLKCGKLRGHNKAHRCWHSLKLG
ncbi:transposase [Pseudoalteromonas viridis]|uniref:Transposase n=1 Tax=Pseudoalteromonas viridis TaxID=339617 RepID=A0ABX7VBM8_9GAMM|nr:transposase [Pseudoalteromonas viridis]